MQIVKSTKFNNQFKEVLHFIALDNKSNAKKFKNELIQKINDLENMPFKFRQSIYFQDESIRDLIFKGYTIVYRVDESLQIITIIGIKKCQEDL